jgi:hypothetical protein
VLSNHRRIKVFQLNIKSFGICLAGLLLSVTAQAGVIYSASPNQSGGSDLNAYREADDFAIEVSSTIQQITFWALQGNANDYSGSVAWAIHNDSDGTPGAVVASGSATPAGTATGQSVADFQEYSYAFALSVSLSPGTYWLKLHNGPDFDLPTTDFFWEWSNSETGNSQSQDLSSLIPSVFNSPVQTAPWTSNFTELAFQVDGTVNESLAGVPEPQTFLLFGAGLLALPFLRRRRN